MTEDQIMDVFFEIHTDLPREGPGNFESTRKAFLMLSDIPEQPLILDVGCGPGLQTLDLANLTEGKIIALDNHQPFLDRLSERVRHLGLTERIRVVNGDMFSLDFEPGSFDLIWAEGSIYIMGFEKALGAWKPLLKKPGYLAATEVAWIKDNPPEELRLFWAEEYPAIQDNEANIASIQRAGYNLIGQFILPESAWWDPYYTPLEERLGHLREKYKNTSEALALVELHQTEIDFYRKYSDYYGYCFYVMQAR